MVARRSHQPLPEMAARMNTTTDNIPSRVAVLEDWRDSKDGADEKRDERIRTLELDAAKLGGKAAVWATVGAAVGSGVVALVLRKLGAG